jgi:hypothetical protein
MILADAVRELTERTLNGLDDSQDYREHTIAAWRVLQRFVAQGEQFTVQNQNTGKSIDEKQLMAKVPHYVTQYLATATFVHFVSLFENFLVDLLRLWLTAFPRSLAENQIKVKEVLEAADRDAIIQSAIDKKLSDVAYGPADGWFRYLATLVNLDCPTPEEIKQFAEIKASRDVLVHNKGITNKKYMEKAGGYARYQDNEVLQLPDTYHRQSWELVRKVIRDIADAVIRKA